MEEPIIKIRNLSKQYRLGSIGGGTLTADLQSWWARIRGKEDPNSVIGEKEGKVGQKFWALDGIDLEINKGEAVGIIGSNGAGKSTLLKILSRVTTPTDGDIWLNGRISSMLEVGTGFHGELTGRENIYMNGAILGMSRQEIDSKLDDIIEFSECGQFIDTPVKRYSSGMYVKLAFAVAAFLDSEILVMDEVLAVGDIKFQEKCLGKMGNAATGEGKTVLYVSHNMNTIRQLCTRCIVLSHGKIIFDGDVETAIGIYSEEAKGDLITKYDLRTCERPSLEHGKKILVESFEFLEKEKAQFVKDEKVRCKLKWKSFEYIKDLRLYLAIKYIDSASVGLMLSEPFSDAIPNDEGEFEFELDFSNLAPGIYYFKINIVEMNEYGNACGYDRPTKDIFLEILPSINEKTINWKRKYMGSVMLNKIKNIGRENEKHEEVTKN